MTAATEATAAKHELVLERTLNASPEKIYRCWTEPALMKQWFAPAPYTVPHAEVDLRAGGSNCITMRSPEGQDMPCRGVYLEVVPNRKLVFTDAYTSAWVPSAKPFMTAVLTFDPVPGDANKTKYTARVFHWTAEDLAQHEAMGFSTGWGICADQLEKVAAAL